MPYFSVLFGDTADETRAKALAARTKGFRAAKFGWGRYGHGSVQEDEDQVAAAREGLGDDGILLVDAGTVWNTDVGAARKRLASLKRARATWLEEPFVSGALDEYRALSLESGAVGMAGGEGSHNFHMAKHMIDHAGLKYVQIDAGRIGGVSVAKQVADYANAKGVTYVNHTFTSHLALSASLQPYVGTEEPCDLRVSGRAESPRAGDHPRASAARRQRAGARAGRAGIGDGGRSGGAEVLSGRHGNPG